MSVFMRSVFIFSGLFLFSALVFCGHAAAQSLGNAGTIQGTVTDPTGAVIPGVVVTVKNPVTGYSQEAKSGTDGTFRLTNLPPNQYLFSAVAEGFAVFPAARMSLKSIPRRTLTWTATSLARFPFPAIPPED